MLLLVVLLFHGLFKKVNYIDFCTNLRNRLLPAILFSNFEDIIRPLLVYFVFQLTLLVPSNVSSDHFSNESVSSFSERTLLVGCHFCGYKQKLCDDYSVLVGL